MKQFTATSLSLSLSLLAAALCSSSSAFQQSPFSPKFASSRSSFRSGRTEQLNLWESSTTASDKNDEALEPSKGAADYGDMQRIELNSNSNSNSNINNSSNNNKEDIASPSSDFPDWVEPLAWRGVIFILCALWASNFAAAKLVMAEPGVDSTLYAVTRFSVAAVALTLPTMFTLWQKKNTIGSSVDADTDTAIGNTSSTSVLATTTAEQQQQQQFTSPSDSNAIVDWKTLSTATQCGAWVAFGYLGQTFGLLTTTASRSCVICSLHCVFVAAIAEYWRVQRSAADTSFNTQRLIPAALAVTGVAIVELQGAGGAPSIGDALSFAQPVGFGMGYLLLEELMEEKPEAALPVSAIKLLVVAISSFLTFELGPAILNPASYASIADFTTNLSHLTLRFPDFGPILASPLAVGGILYTGLVTTALALWVESKAFAKVPATDASIILTTEPLIAALVGAITLGETFGLSDYVGASLIIGACAYAVLMDGNKEEQPALEESS